MFIAGLGEKTAYAHNIGYLKKYTNELYRLSILNTVRLPGFEERNPKLPTKKGEAGNSEKLENSLSRSKHVIWELAICNPWDYFITLTVDGEKMDRYDLSAIYKKLGKWINNYNTHKGASIKYLLIPEPHKDGAWHFHGLLSGIPPNHLILFNKDGCIPQHIKSMLEEGRMVYNWPAYSASFGFVTVEAISNSEHCAKYMTKYITKELLQSTINLDAHVYYCSQGLKRPELLYSGPITQEIENPDFQNDYVHMKNFKSAEEALPYFCDKEEI